MDRVRFLDFNNDFNVFGQNKTVVMELFCFITPVSNVK